jgi:hypothetical protein
MCKPDVDVAAINAVGIAGQVLTLRRMMTDKGSPRPEFKLTQKVPVFGSGAIQGMITTIYLSRAEHDLLATLPAGRADQDSS